MKAIRLKTEYLAAPLGIDTQNPRMQWNCEGGTSQTAYRLLCRDAATGTLLWDSGKVAESTMQAAYPLPLASRQRVIWQLQLWDETDIPGPISESCFEMGLLHTEDWQAGWISGDYVVNKNRRYPVDCFCKSFTLEQLPQCARLYATACGLYEITVNGVRAGDHVLAPGHTDYRKRVQYQTVDVTHLLRKGQNTVEILLADGWYRGSCGAWGIRNQYGSRTKVLAQLEGDGAVLLATDAGWRWSNDGPIRFADNKDGEVVDARMAPSYSGRAKPAHHPVVPTASNNVPVREKELFTPGVITTPGGSTVLDFGQNIAGYIRFELTAKAGQRVFLRFGEILDADGEFTQHNIQCSSKHRTSPLQQVEYICTGGQNSYKTRFAVFGFRYALLETDAPWRAEDFTAIAVYSDMEQTGFFDCSEPLLNQFVQNTVWSTKGNSLDVPTDCPTRERHGWTGDSQIFFDTASYLFDFAPFAKKHLRDVFDWQRRNGNLPQIAPAGGVDFYMDTMNGSPGWSDIGILMPYRFWKKYGDKNILQQYYDGMKQYAAFLRRRCGKKTLLSKPLGLYGKARRWAVNYGQSYGEWAEPADVFPNDWKDMVLPHPEVSTAYTAHCFALFARMAEALGDADTAAEYALLAEKVKLSYQAMRRLPAFTLDTDRQAMLVRPLAFDLLDAEQTAYAKKRLLTALENYGWRLGTGFLSTPLILYVLAEIDPAAALRLLENQQMPGWLYMPKTGATTVWENWEGNADQKGLGSMNHYSKGAVCAWLFDSLCGIRVAGQNHFTVCPCPGGSLTHAKAAYQSVYGLIESGWVQTDGKICYTVTVPANCTAEVRLPDGSCHSVAAGTHIFDN